jgi:hypothetical protein
MKSLTYVLVAGDCLLWPGESVAAWQERRKQKICQAARLCRPHTRPGLRRVVAAPKRLLWAVDKP